MKVTSMRKGALAHLARQRAEVAHPGARRVDFGSAEMFGHDAEKEARI